MRMKQFNDPRALFSCVHTTTFSFSTCVHLQRSRLSSRAFEEFGEFEESGGLRRSPAGEFVEFEHFGEEFGEQEFGEEEFGEEFGICVWNLRSF